MRAAERRPAETPAGVRPLVLLLASAKKAERLRGASLVGRFGSAAWSAAATLDYTMRADPDTAVANEAAAALARIGRAGPSSPPLWRISPPRCGSGPRRRWT
jgi:hypothetical protein